MMRVIHVINGLGTGGAERSAAESVGPLRDRGIEVEFAVMHVRNTGVSAEVAERTAVHELSGPPRDRVRQLRSLVTDGAFDLIHTTLFEADLLGRFASIGLRAPVLTSMVNTSYDRVRLHDPNVRRMRLAAARILDGGSGRLLTNHWHAISEVVARAAVQHLRVPRSRITVIPRGRSLARLGKRTDTRRAEARARLGLTFGDIMLLNVGRQEFQKGQVHAVEALDHVRNAFPTARLFIAGRDGNATSAIRERIDAVGVRDAVEILGHVDNVPDLLVAADALVFPSLFEGLGGTLIEAMALETPIVTSDLAVTREVTAGAARLVKPADASALADGIRAVLSDHALRREMIARGTEQFAERFDLEQVMNKTAAMMRGVVDRASAGRPRRC